MAHHLFSSCCQNVLRDTLKELLDDMHILRVTDPIDTVQPGDPEDMRGCITCGEKKFYFDLIMYTGGRLANSEGLGLEDTGIRLYRGGGGTRWRGRGLMDDSL